MGLVEQVARGQATIPKMTYVDVDPSRLEGVDNRTDGRPKTAGDANRGSHAGSRRSPGLELRVQAPDRLSFDRSRRGPCAARREWRWQIDAYQDPRGRDSRDGGEIDFEGRPLETRSALAVELGIACLFQEPALVPGLTIECVSGRDVQPSGLIRSRPQHEQALSLLQQVAPHLDQSWPTGRGLSRERASICRAC